MIHHTRAARRARARRPARARRRPSSRSPTTTRATSPATTTCSRRRASSSPRSGKPVEMKRQRQADVLLRRRRRAHVDGGARHADQRGARARGGRDRRRDARGRVPVLHGDARRRRPGGRQASCASSTSRRCSPSRSATGSASSGRPSSRRGLALVEPMFHNLTWRRPGPRRSTAPRSCSCASSRAPQPLAVGELAAGAGLPKSTTSRLVGALERQGSSSGSASAARCSPGRCCSASRSADGARRASSSSPRPSLALLADASGETINLAVPGAARRRAPRAARQRALRRRHELGRPARAAPRARRTARSSSRSARRRCPTPLER